MNEGKVRKKGGIGAKGRKERHSKKGYEKDMITKKTSTLNSVTVYSDLP